MLLKVRKILNWLKFIKLSRIVAVSRKTGIKKRVQKVKKKIFLSLVHKQNLQQIVKKNRWSRFLFFFLTFGEIKEKSFYIFIYPSNCQEKQIFSKNNHQKPKCQIFYIFLDKLTKKK